MKCQIYEVFQVFFLVYVSLGIPRKIFWTLISLALLGVLCVNGYDIIWKYLDYDVLVKTTITRERQLLFPAVTICNSNGFKEDKITNLHKNYMRNNSKTPGMLIKFTWISNIIFFSK